VNTKNGIVGAGSLVLRIVLYLRFFPYLDRNAKRRLFLCVTPFGHQTMSLHCAGYPSKARFVLGSIRELLPLLSLLPVFRL